MQAFKTSRSVKNLHKHQILGTVEEFNKSEKKKMAERIKVPKHSLKKVSTTIAIPVILNTGGSLATDVNHASVVYSKLPAIRRITTAKTSLEDEKPRITENIVSGTKEAFKQKLKGIRDTKNYHTVSSNYVEGKIYEIQKRIEVNETALDKGLVRYGDENRVEENTIGVFERSIETINTRSSIAIKDTDHDMSHNIAAKEI